MGQIQDHIRHNVRVKKYPDGCADILIADRAIFREPGWEERGKRDEGEPWWLPLYDIPAVEKSAAQLAREEEEEQQRCADNLARSVRRARSALADLALSNPWEFFVTLTLDAAKIDRYEVREITRKLNNWLDNHVRRDGLAYVLVPELHKDGAVHFHGFFNGALDAVDSGTIDYHGKPRRPRSERQRAEWLADGGHIVYNLPAWTLGYTSAIRLYGDHRAAVGYVCKYITKAARAPQRPDGKPAGKIGGRWYYSGGDLRRPEVSLCDVPFDSFAADTDARRFVIEALGCKVLALHAEGGDLHDFQA